MSRSREVPDQQIRQLIGDLARQELGWAGELPAGDLTEHLDSVQRLSLVVALEDHFEICLDLDPDEEVRTVDEVVALVRRQLDA